MIFNEDLLQFAWRFGLYRGDGLETSQGEPIEILNTGIQNFNSGPDFEGARLRIANTLWVGNVEIHVRSSDWIRHHHHQDSAYDNVVLHVVYAHDEEISRTDGSPIPTLVLGTRVKAEVLADYQRLMTNMNWIPCETLLERVEEVHRVSWLERMMVERLEHKTWQINDVLEASKGNWEETFYFFLARNFGFKVNALPFELLARAVPLTIVHKHRAASLQVEALYFGQSGLLPGRPEDDYPRLLLHEYGFLRKKWRLRPIDGYLWRFSRLRPQNFPTRRLAQFVALICQSSSLFSKALELRRPADALALFDLNDVPEYWNEHYRFDKSSATVSPKLGQQSIWNLVENTVVPFLFAYGRFIGDDRYMDTALALLENLPPETNAQVKRFNEIGLRSTNAAASQAVLHLKKMYCDGKKCLNCGIGIILMNQNK